MAENTDETRKMMDEILRRMDSGFAATALDFKALRSEMRGLALDLQSFQSETQKQIENLSQALQDFKTATEARFARSVIEVGDVVREVGDYLYKKITATNKKFVDLNKIALKTARGKRKLCRTGRKSCFVGGSRRGKIIEPLPRAKVAPASNMLTRSNGVPARPPFSILHKGARVQTRIRRD